MPSGTVRSIHVARSAGLPMDAPGEVLAVAGRGLEGDRYATGLGFYSNRPEPGRHVTLIAAEALMELERASGIRLDPGAHRRNLVTEGIDLDALIGRAFTVGAVRLRGIKPCVPCLHIADLNGEPDLLAALVGRGGLRADIVAGGMIRVGDAIALA
jgi:MOSC domain-containing protein YiiM